ncbi:acyltransferase family protein [Nocardioides exalbidus]|uniref:acyltransferase family protein n=1 Tax=Nocardioides exalbidus TaxID=402596 RepID=UPI001587AC77|nr:acyltransferase [Nocardioides exalbidus]
MNLGDRLDDGANNFDVIRLFMAWAVLVSHSFTIVGVAEPFHQLGTTLGSAAVLIFFAISGLLIRRSWELDPRPVAFLRKRSLRILPALVVVSVTCALVLGPLVTDLPFRQYFSSMQTWSYPCWTVLMTPFGAVLPGVFVDLPRAYNVNGPLWTLRYEVIAYGLLLVMGMTQALSSRRIVTAVAATAIVWACLVAPEAPLFGGWNAVAAFAVGACAWSWRDRIGLSHPGAALAVLACLASGLTGLLTVHVAVWTVAAVYLAFWAAFALPLFGQRLVSWGDASYGLYIYAWPVQQSIVQFLGTDTSPLLVTALATPAAWMLALASWLLVERPALRGKPAPGPRSAPRPLAGHIGRE